MSDNKDFFSLNNVELEQAYKITIGARNGGKLFYFERLCIKQREEINRQKAEIERLKELSDTVIADLKYYLETNEENGVVYIPKNFVEKTLNNLKELVG